MSEQQEFDPRHEAAKRQELKLIIEELSATAAGVTSEKLSAALRIARSAHEQLSGLKTEVPKATVNEQEDNKEAEIRKLNDIFDHLERQFGGLPEAVSTTLDVEKMTQMIVEDQNTYYKMPCATINVKLTQEEAQKILNEKKESKPKNIGEDELAEMWLKLSNFAKRREEKGLPPMEKKYTVRDTFMKSQYRVEAETSRRINIECLGGYRIIVTIDFVSLPVYEVSAGDEKTPLNLVETYIQSVYAYEREKFLKMAKSGNAKPVELTNDAEVTKLMAIYKSAPTFEQMLAKTGWEKAYTPGGFSYMVVSMDKVQLLEVLSPFSEKPDTNDSTRKRLTGTSVRALCNNGVIRLYVDKYEDGSWAITEIKDEF